MRLSPMQKLSMVLVGLVLGVLGAGIAWAQTVYPPIKAGGGVLMNAQASWQGGTGVVGVYYKSGGSPGLYARHADNTETGPLAVGSTNGLKAVYEAASGAGQNIIGLAAGTGYIRIRDNATPLATPLLSIESSGATEYYTFGITGASFTMPAASSGAPIAFNVQPGAHTGLSAGANVVDIDFALNRTVQRSTGAVALAEAIRVRPPTYSFVGASVVTNAATVSISGAPVAGANATITNSYALWLKAGMLAINDDTLTTSTATGALLQNTTAATNGNQKVSPAMTMEGRGWSTGSSASRIVGARFFVTPVQNTEPEPDLHFQVLNGAGAYTTVGRLGQYTTASGFKLQSASGNEYMSIDGPITGFQFVIGGASEYYMDASASYPNGDAVNDSGKSTDRWSRVWSRTTVVGDTAGNKPTCDSTLRGGLYLTRATAGNPDTLEACMKAAADTYAWRVVFTAP